MPDLQAVAGAAQLATRMQCKTSQVFDQCIRRFAPHTAFGGLQAHACYAIASNMAFALLRLSAIQKVRPSAGADVSAPDIARVREHMLLCAMQQMRRLGYLGHARRRAHHAVQWMRSIRSRPTGG